MWEQSRHRLWLACPVSATDREIYRPQDPGGPLSVGVFIGIHGDHWVGNAIASIERQEIDRVEVVAAVNGHFPNALRLLREWQATSRHAVTVVRNARNLGPLGSWYLNRDLLAAPWVAVMHQDDVYGARHLPVLMAAAEQAPADVLAVFSSMSGIDEADRPLAPPPMDNSHLDLAPTWQTLPAILRRHPLPTPAVLLRNPAGFVDGLAWYDSGAPDSEWFATLACRGRFRILPEITMRYRTSPSSESHSTGWESRAWQWAQSVDRIVNSRDFAMAMSNVPAERRGEFAEDLLSAIPARYPQSPIFGFLQFVAAQRMAAAWGYEAGPATQLLARYLAIAPESAASRNLLGITGQEKTPHDARVAPELEALLGPPPDRGRVEEAGRDAYRRWGHLLPRRAQMGAYRLYDRLWGGRGAR